MQSSTSAAEAETGDAFEKAQNLVLIRRICEHVFNHPKPKEGSPLMTDNSTSTSLLNKLIKPRRSKSWDMRHHWLEDRIQDNTIQLFWRPGQYNRADDFMLNLYTPTWVEEHMVTSDSS